MVEDTAVTVGAMAAAMVVVVMDMATDRMVACTVEGLGMWSLRSFSKLR